MIDRISAGEPIPVLVLSLIGLFLTDAGLLGLQGYILGKTGSGVILDLRERLTRHLLHANVSEHDRQRTGDLLTRVGTDTTILRTVLTTGVVQAFLASVTIIGAIVLMAFVDWILLVLTLVGLLLPIGIAAYFQPKLRATSKQAQDSVGEMTAALERSLGAIRTVKAYSAEDREANYVLRLAKDAYNAGVRFVTLGSIMGPGSGIVMQGLFLTVLGVGGARLAAGQLSVAALVTFLLYLLFMVGPVLQLSSFLSQIAVGMAAVERLNVVLSLKLDPAIESDPTNLGANLEDRAPETPLLEFDSVSHSYDGRRQVLHDVSFQVHKGTKTAIVGPSGAGKSTLFSLIERFYDPKSGVVRFAGVNAKQMPVGVLRKSIGYVEQSSPVMAGSLLSNLLYAKPDASEDEVEAVVDRVSLRPFVAQLPHGLDTEVGDHGVLLSGGENQRIAIARAILAAPRLLLLDEPTSQLDSNNEQIFKQLMSEMKEETTMLVIAHRLSTVIDADQIVVVDGGKIRGLGTHDELLCSNPLYKNLVEQQFVQ